MHSDISGPAGRLHVDDGGTGGVAVVFVHAFAGSSTHWTEQVEHIRRDRRAIALDLRGHGRSDAIAGEDVSIEDLAADIAAVAAALRLERFVLVGHSIGGAAAIALAGEAPERVAGLLLVGTPGRVPIEQADQIVSAMTSDYDETMSGYWDRLLADATPKVKDQIEAEREHMPQDAAIALIRATFAYDPLSALQDYAGPTLAVTSGDGPNDLHNQVAELPHEQISGASHWVHMDRPAEFNRILDAFLARVDDAEAGSRRSPAGRATATAR